jgi:oligopeptide transport system permease protein
MAFKHNFLSLQIDPKGFALAADDEKARQVTMRESVSFFRDAMRRLFRNPIAVVSLGLIVLVMLAAFLTPAFYPYRYSGQDMDSRNLGPMEYSADELRRQAQGEKLFPHLMGTDDFGRDYAVRVLYGTRISLMVGILAAFIVVVIGVLYGSASGYFGGRLDMVMMRIVDVIYALPDVLMVILLSVFLKGFIQSSDNPFLLRVGSGMISIFIVFGLFYWVGMARQVRGQILSIKEQEYVLAARAIGAGAGHIIRKHMIPNCVSVIIIVAAMQIPSAIFTESFLSYLGLGVSIPMPSLGSLVADAKDGLQSHPFLLLFPAAMIFLIVLSFNLLGTGLRDAFDPKMRTQGVR